MEQPDCRRIGKEPVSLQYFFIKFQLIGTEGTGLLREKRGQGDPAGERRGRTARGKRVPGVEIITHTS
jgi:hypothetical protein